MSIEHIVLSTLTTCSFCGLALSQGAAFQTPGQSPWSGSYGPPRAESGQTDRFTSVFNPAFSFVVDSLFDWTEFDDEDDGLSLHLQSAEFGAQTWIDPNAWAYFVAVADEETVAIEEAAVHYTGLGGHHTIRAGRFFLDFGKQMQNHVHELRTIDRPLVLRAYLGAEVKGDGAQWDSWTSFGETTAVRWSLGVFGNLVPESEEDEESALISVADRKDPEDLNFSARVTGFTDVGDSGVFQLGASARSIPSYTVEFDGATPIEDLDNTVIGVDATYGWSDETGLKRWTFGAEALLSTGDIGADVDLGGPTIAVIDDDAIGFYAFADYAWNPQNSVGLQYSQAELPTADLPDADEIDVYYTRNFSEFHRIRLAVTSASFDDDAGDDSLRVGIQYTVFGGAHGHGVNW